MTVFQTIGIFFIGCLLAMSGCGRSQTDWENLYQIESDGKEFSEKISDTASDETANEVSDRIEQHTKEQAEKSEIAATVQIYICGAVVCPGVYELPEGARVNRAIEAAGGLTEDADLLLVNQARVVEDGEQIRIYTIEEAAEAELEVGQGIKTGDQTEADANGNDKVNINEADADVLMTLPGIGEAKASAIIEYRQTNGSFQVIDDIMNIPGIKEAVFSKIKDRITV